MNKWEKKNCIEHESTQNIQIELINVTEYEIDKNHSEQRSSMLAAQNQDERIYSCLNEQKSA